MRTRAAVSSRRIAPEIGVELSGLDLTGPLDDTTVAIVQRAVADHHVAVVRGQFLTVEQHAALAGVFGPLGAHPTRLLLAQGRPLDPTSLVSTIEDTADRPPAGFPWHTDLSWTPSPPMTGVLNAIVIPPTGGDTMWASTAAIYDRLTPDDQLRCYASSALHAPDDSLLASVRRHHGTEVAGRLRRAYPPIEHPLVNVHPVTGRHSLYLSPLYCDRIVGPAGSDGRLLARLHEMIDDPAVQMRWQWQPGDVVMWDETSTCHKALTDHYPQRRVMRRTAALRPGR